MKFIILENPEFGLNKSEGKVEDGFVLINLDWVHEIIIDSKTGRAILSLNDNKVYYLNKEETIILLRTINDSKITNPVSLEKIYSQIQNNEV